MDYHYRGKCEKNTWDYYLMARNTKAIFPTKKTTTRNMMKPGMTDVSTICVTLMYSNPLNSNSYNMSAHFSVTGGSLARFQGFPNNMER